MDLDGDGIEDVITGSYPGELYLFPGRGDGTFAAPVRIQDQGGADVKLDRASALFAADWDRDGDLDLVVGDIRGHVWWVENASGDATLQLLPGQKLATQGAEEAIRVPGGDAGPCLADWDGDGTLDLVVGCGDGSVLLFANRAPGGAPRLAEPVTLLASGGGMNLAADAPMRPGSRAKPCVCDFDGDGRLDLLVGDFLLESLPAPELSPQDAALATRLRAKLAWIQERYAPAVDRLGREAFARVTGSPPETTLSRAIAGLDDAAREAYGLEVQASMKTDVPVRALTRMMQETRKALSAMEPKRAYHGHVWLLRGSSPAEPPGVAD